MRLSWGQGAITAITLVVAVGMLQLPSRVLGPAGALQAPINLPQSLSPSVVLAAPAPRVIKIRLRPAPRPPAAAHPHVVKAPVVHPAPPRPQPVAHVASPAPVPPLTIALGEARHLPPPPDEAASPRAP